MNPVTTSFNNPIIILPSKKEIISHFEKKLMPLYAKYSTVMGEIADDLAGKQVRLFGICIDVSQKLENLKMDSTFRKQLCSCLITALKACSIPSCRL